jgi:hypothetical protein
MNKFGQLLNRIEKFSIDAHFEYQMAKFAAETSDLISRSEEFDIKDEELFNQFESFMSGYKELMDTLKVDAAHLDPESFEDAGELVSTLQERLKRIISNPYLDMGEEQGWEEDFDPGEFTKFLIQVSADAEAKLKAVAGEDFEISDMKAAQLAKEFNQQGIDKGDKNITWTGNKIQQSIEARKKWFENLQRDKVLNPERYQSYIESRKKTYKDIMSSPERKSHYREQARKRQIKFNVKLDNRKLEIIEKLKKEKHPYTINKLEEELRGIEQQIKERDTRRNSVRKEQAKQVKEVKNSGTLNGLIVHYSQRLASFKKDAAKAIKVKAAKDPFFANFKLAVQTAKENFDKDPNLLNKSSLEDAVKKEVAAIEEHLNRNPVVERIKTDFVVLYAFRDKLSEELLKTGWLELPSIPEEIKPILGMIANDADELINNYSNSYPRPLKIVREISNLIKSKI